MTAAQLEVESAIRFHLAPVAVVVHFRLEGEAADLAVAPPAGTLMTFHRGDVAVTLERERDGWGFDCLIAAHTTRDIPDDVYRMLEERIAPPKPVARLQIVELWPPAPVDRLCSDVHAELETEAARLVQLLRWRFNREAPAKPLGSVQLSWSVDGSDWHPAPTKWGIDLPDAFGGEVELDETGSESIGRIWEAGEVEPVARQILLEAYALAFQNPRAALVLGVAAAEVGVKQFAASQSRESEAWLVSKMPSPPILTLLRDYVHFLTDRRTTDRRAVPKKLQTAIHKAAQARNDIVHRGETGYDAEPLLEALGAVNDLLYLLDWFAGHAWAVEHLQHETRHAYEL